MGHSKKGSYGNNRGSRPEWFSHARKWEQDDYRINGARHDPAPRGRFSKERSRPGSSWPRGRGRPRGTWWCAERNGAGKTASENNNDEQDQAGSSRPRGGRALGMWYAERSRARKKALEKRQRPVVRMNDVQMTAACVALDRIDQANLTLQQNTEETKKSEGDSADGTSNLDDSFDLELELQGDSRLDEELFQKLTANLESEPYKKMLKFRKNLPAYKMKEELVSLVNSNQVVVVSGETGCGKTTQVPQFILDDAINRGMGSTCRVVCTQPRRISAISVAQRVASERAEPCGEGNSCGYQIRLDKQLPRERGSILYCTTGILIQWLQTDPLLSSVSHVILDEIHERDLHSDFLITIIKNIIMKRKSLTIVLMSATLNADLFSEYFSNCPKINIPGFTFPVKEYYLEEIMDMLCYEPTGDARSAMDRICRQRYDHKAMRGANKAERQSALADRSAYLTELQDYERTLQEKYSPKFCRDVCTMDVYLQRNIDINLVVTLIKHLIRHPPAEEATGGAILVFLPGWEEIKQINDAVKKDTSFFTPSKFIVIPLHSLMPSPDQRKVFERPPAGVTKLVLATNIAETSITIDDIVYVIDCGKLKIRKFEHGKNLETLGPDWVTRANARQRRGRAGRVQDGYCFHLFTELQNSKLDDFMVPEILRIRLDQLCLQIKLLKLGKLKAFLSEVLEPPSSEAVDLSIEQLTALNALDAHERLMPLGHHLAKLPVPPSIGKMLLFGAMFKCLDPILTIAACLSFKSPFVVPLGKEEAADERRRQLADDTNSDHLMLVKAYNGWLEACEHGSASDYCWTNFMSTSVLKMLKNMRGQFVEHLRESGFLFGRDVEEWNLHSGDDKIVLAVVCAGLYPNVAKLYKHKPHKPPKISSKREPRLALHPKSVNSFKTADKFPGQWFCYYEKMKTTKVFLYDTSEVSPYPLLFFGGDIGTFKDEGQDMISVDDWIQFKASPDVASTVHALRNELDKILERKISKPFDPFHKADRSVISAIIHLISNE